MFLPAYAGKIIIIKKSRRGLKSLVALQCDFPSNALQLVSPITQIYYPKQKLPHPELK